MDDARTFEDLAWLRRLARRLVRDAARADDAVQQTLLVARRARGPRSRGWLATVLRNQLRQDARAEARRGERERSRPQRGAAPAADDLVAELELHQRLAEHVHALDEPYRETLLLRFLREWSPRRIAAHQGVPVKTVHTRIERGLTRLRTRLDRAAPREEWLGAMALIAAPRAAVPVSLTSAGAGALLITMKAKLTVAIVVALAALGALPFLLDVDGDAADTRTVARSAAGGQALDEPLDASGPGDDARSSAALAAPPSEEPTERDATAAAPASIRGRAVDATGQPISGVEVVYEPRAGEFFSAPLEGSRASSAGDGSFSIQAPGVAGRVTCIGDVWAAIHRPYLQYGEAPLGGREVVLVVTPRRAYAGHVRAPDGSPIGDAEVRIGFAERYYEPLVLLDAVVPMRSTLATTTTDASGAFRFDAVGFMEGAWIDASFDGFGDVRTALSSTSDLAIELVLPEEDEVERSIAGQVLGTAGVGVEGAFVSVGLGFTRTGPEGRFRIDASPNDGGAFVRAFHPEEGHGEAHLDAAALEAAVAGDGVRVLLAGPTRTIRGRVVDPEGRPVAGARVWTPDTTHFGSAPVGGERRMTANATLEALASGAEWPWGRVVETQTDAEGAFALGGLAAREYDLFAAEPRSLAASGAVTVPGAETTVRITLEDARAARPIAGRVLTTAGEPVAGVEVTVHRELDWERPVRAVDPWGGSPLRAPGASIATPQGAARTDREGRFAFDAVITEGATLRIPNDRAFYPPVIDLESVDDPLDIEVITRERATVLLEARTDADAFEIVTREGDYQPVFIQVEQSRLSTLRIPLTNGRAVPLLTGSGPATVVLFRGDEVLERVDVELVGGVNELEL